MGIPIGRLLQQAGLATSEQIKVARAEQEEDWQPLGQILAAKGFIQKETVDFFVNEWPRIQAGLKRASLEDCLLAAQLITPEQLVISQQDTAQSGLGVESVFVINGWVSEVTINFFREHLAVAAEAAEENSTQDKIGSATVLPSHPAGGVPGAVNQVGQPASSYRTQGPSSEGAKGAEDDSVVLKILKSDISDVPKILQTLLSSDEDEPKDKG